MKNIHPVSDFGRDLLSVQNPARYIGGEYGQIVKEHADITFAMAFPDLYEIGMSNQAVKIIYNGLNAMENVRCERVFAPDSDFEDLLKKKHIPLYTLETGIPLCETDIVGFSIGYEMGITGVLLMLDCGQIPLCCSSRTENDPIIIAGGCGVTNPAPFSMFFDAVFIGEAEAGMFTLISELGTMKKNGATRRELLDYLCSHPAVWIPGKKARRAVQYEFGQVPSVPSCFPMPVIKPVQDHGVVEIMRGCPNGCRFCHAGIYYRPQRMKPMAEIIAETDRLVFEAGYREISLTSLSSGDYEGISDLLDVLNSRYTQFPVSFQLPSLKVNSFNLSVLEKLSQVRKSGLTFAVETPVEAWQFALNKEVYSSHLVDIILDAKKRGWSSAKFYFMIGLPVENATDTLHEEEAIVQFLLDIQAKTRIQCSVNVGTFIPKPHTAYQWIRQLSMEESKRKLDYIRRSLPRGKFKVSTHDVFVSFIEGMISRGSAKVGNIILAAYKNGCRLDAWEDRMKKDVWKQVIADAGWNVEDEVYRTRDVSEPLPWDDISLGVSKTFFIREYERSISRTLTPVCGSDCTEPCGICTKQKKVYKVSQDVQKSILSEIPPLDLGGLQYANLDEYNIPVLWRVVARFSKRNGAEFLPHLAVLEQFYKAFLRAKLPVMYTQGFNPIPRMEFATCTSVGIASDAEIVSFMLRTEMDSRTLIAAINDKIGSNLRVEECMILPVSNKRKRESLSSLLWGAKYEYAFSGNLEKSPESFFSSDLFRTVETEKNVKICHTKISGTVYEVILPFSADRAFRDALSAFFEMPVYSAVSMCRRETFARAVSKTPAVSDCAGTAGTAGIYETYFEAFARIAEENSKLIGTV